ncbi:MAG: potassium channel protein [Acidobacteria bacterium]|nr:potassium channel protein [Acidobacteriota bacterium]MBI3470638.1 potassium channel protein [Candidatus Solibacter usitatus]
MDQLKRRLTYIAALIAATLLIGTAGFTWIDGYDPFNAFYMTLITVTTVGYGEVQQLSRAGRIFNSFLIFVGVTVMFIAIGAMTQTIIELELGAFFGKRRIKRMIEKLSDHFIVCGFGRVGRGTASELQRSGAAFVVVDRDDDRVERAIKAGMLAVVADASHDETLREVGIERAKGLVSALPSDAENLFVILSARALNPKLYLAARVVEEEAETKMRRAGADVVFAPYTTTGQRLAQAMVRPHVHQFLEFTTKNLGLKVAIEQVRVPESSEFVSHTLQQMQLRRDFGVIVLAIRKADGQMVFNPPAEALIAGSDHLIVMGEPESLRKLETVLT